MDLTFHYCDLVNVSRANDYGDPLQFAKDLSRYHRVFIVYPNTMVGYEDGELIINEIFVSGS